MEETRHEIPGNPTPLSLADIRIIMGAFELIREEREEREKELGEEEAARRRKLSEERNAHLSTASLERIIRRLKGLLDANDAGGDILQQQVQEDIEAIVEMLNEFLEEKIVEDPIAEQMEDDPYPEPDQELAKKLVHLFEGVADKKENEESQMTKETK